MKNSILLIVCVLCFITAANSQELEKQVWTLEECINYALENNLDIKRSNLNVETTEINWNQNKLQRLPNLNANGSYGRNWGRSIDPVTNLFVDQAINSVNMSASSQVVLFNGFSINNSIKQSQYTYESIRKELDVTRNNVMLDIVSFYTNILFTRELLENARKQLSTIEEQANRTKIQVEAGALAQSNLLDIEAQLATNEFNLVTAENNYVQAQLQLKLAMQLPPTAEIQIEVPPLEVETDLIMELSAYEIYELALKNMPEIQAAEFNLESTEYGIKSAKGNMYPTLSLSGNVFTNYSDRVDSRTLPDGTSTPTTVVVGQVPSTGENVTSIVQIPNTTVEDFGFSQQVNQNLSKAVSVGLNIPIFNRFSARYDYQRAKINRDIAEIDKQSREYLLWQQVQQSYNDVVAASKSYVSSTSQVTALEESFRVTENRYNNGAANFVDYQIAENNFFQAQSDLLRAKYDLIFKQKILDFYQGKPIEF